MTLRARLKFGLLIIAVILIVPLLVATRSLDRLHAQTKAVRGARAAGGSGQRALRERTRARVADAASQAKDAKTVALVALLLAVIVATFLAVRLTRQISEPIAELERGMRQVADGDFGTRLT